MLLLKTKMLFKYNSFCWVTFHIFLHKEMQRQLVLPKKAGRILNTTLCLGSAKPVLSTWRPRWHGRHTCPTNIQKSTISSVKCVAEDLKVTKDSDCTTGCTTAMRRTISPSVPCVPRNFPVAVAWPVIWSLIEGEKISSVRLVVEPSSTRKLWKRIIVKSNNHESYWYIETSRSYFDSYHSHSCVLWNIL